MARASGGNVQQVNALAVVAAALSLGAADVPPDQTVYRIGFADARRGVLSAARPNAPCADGLCAHHVYATSDGGATWRRTLSARTSVGDIAHLSAAPGTSTVFASYPCREPALCASRVYRSDDFGRTWRLVSRAWLWDPAFATPRDGWARGSSGLVATRDGGRTWRQVARHPCPDYANDWYYPALVAPARGYVLCRSSDLTFPRERGVHETRDGGRTWRLRSALGYEYGRVGSGHRDSFALRHVSFRPSGRGWIWRFAGTPLVTSDGGRTWRKATTRWPHSLIWGAAVTDGLAFALAETTREQLLLRTVDGGRTWQAVKRWPK
ncbi:MAG: hypothetical protein ICV67_00485 [Thermoleophilia bacterium]|nr:hypothetical protein [Thermoleophilia bacterium]